MKWILQPKIDSSSEKELQKYGPIISQLLFNRGIKTLKDSEIFFSEEGFGDSSLFVDIEKAAERVITAIKKKEKILVYGDYDVDGVSSTALLWDYLYNYRGADVEVFIPNRFVDGYGVKFEQIEKYIKKGVSLVITVDCGIKDHNIVEEIKSKGVDVIITDHHTPEKEFPSSYAVIHPSHGYNFRDLAGVGVVWKLISYVEGKYPSGVDIHEFLDLVTLGTVCDLMPLIGENRSIVKHGLKRIRDTKRLGLINLIKNSDILFQDIDTYHIGYILGPKLNASGRLEDALYSFKLLTTKDEAEAVELSMKLNLLNRERQNQTMKAVEEAMSTVDNTKNILIAIGDDWSEGVVGLVAGKLHEKTGKPSIALTRKGNVYIGSCRSPEGVNIVNLLEGVKDLLISYGGHAQAAGLKVDSSNLEILRKELESAMEDANLKSFLEKSLKVDMGINLYDIDWQLVNNMKQLAPFGIKNPSPIFSVDEVKVISAQTMGADGKHLRLKLTPFAKSGNFLPSIQAVGFGMGDLMSKLSLGTVVDIVGNIEENIWNGNSSIQFKLKDIHF